MTDSIPEHVRRPHLRPVQPIPVKKDGQAFVALRDPAMLTRETMVIPVPAFQAIQQFNGNQTIDEIAARFGGPLDQFVKLAEGLDGRGLLWGPTFERLEGEMRDRISAAGAFPVTASQALGDDEAACRAKLDEYLAETEDPEIEETIVGLVAPHLDYERGWPNYAAAYVALRGQDAPDRVVILGTNHFGLGDGVVMGEHGFDTPLGRCEPDTAVVGRLIEQLGRPLIVDQLDLVPEHSVELQLPWIRHCLGDVPVVAALIPDPLAPMIEDDDARVRTADFIPALAEILGDVGGRTLFIASSDLSHVGPQFGEPRPVDEQRRFDVERHDREMMAKFIAADAEEFVAAFQWNKNPTRWCSIGNMAAVLALGRPEAVELIDYRQAYDDRGSVMVTSAAMALVDG